MIFKVGTRLEVYHSFHRKRHCKWESLRFVAK